MIDSGGGGGGGSDCGVIDSSGGGRVSDSGGGGGFEHGYLMITIERRMGGNGKGAGEIKKTVRNDYNMVPLRNSHPRQFTSIFWSYPG